MATTVAGHAFTTLHLSSLAAFTREENLASRRVMEKVGFLYERDLLDERSLPSQGGFVQWSLKPVVGTIPRNAGAGELQCSAAHPAA